jgi:hypothetical protein
VWRPQHRAGLDFPGGVKLPPTRPAGRPPARDGVPAQRSGQKRRPRGLSP